MMTIEEKAKAYDDAPKRVKNLENTTTEEDSLIGYIFPQLKESEDKESEDERIRKELLEEIEFIIPHDDETDNEGLILPSYHARIDRYKSYLEKRKEQKPAKWNEEDEYYRNQLIVFCENCMQQDSEAIRCATWLKSLRPKPHWKPSEEQIYSLGTVVNGYDNCTVGSVGYDLKELYEQLKKLM